MFRGASRLQYLVGWSSLLLNSSRFRLYCGFWRLKAVLSWIIFMYKAVVNHMLSLMIFAEKSVRFEEKKNRTSKMPQILRRFGWINVCVFPQRRSSSSCYVSYYIHVAVNPERQDFNLYDSTVILRPIELRWGVFFASHIRINVIDRVTGAFVPAQPFPQLGGLDNYPV